ncbi:hypothetical protein SAM23877_p023 (plasmid) [Streptomyces ambofaciens ATCC 23877]|uniref:Uncharacterized protein n=1 Tax=Streptomyces ambofaciens (strain ATCC 23877 / 3486 / DSM 40053 / JCM 4204 / NBRC 12836 / NRRL B-2516) TaxID=278992 RepID=A0A0K2B6P0_STRA7|nr:hypothetical protein [Streptomyces ambofaciens]AKZ60732.1 hypothetical protein SAM23877_p023 [Streptomyces ambofaciens ATCC 23877]
MNVTKNPDGSHNPPYDENWPPHLEVKWTAGVAACETGLRIHVIDLDNDKYAVHVGGSGQSPMDRESVYAYLDGVVAGAREARKASRDGASTA